MSDRKENAKTTGKLQDGGKKSMFAGKDKSSPSKSGCFLRSSNHYLSNCNQFLKKSVADRFGFCEERKLCTRCFSNNHIEAECKGRKCSKCDRNHNTLLHREVFSSKTQFKDTLKSVDGNSKSIDKTCNISATSNRIVVMPTAVVKILTTEKRTTYVRVLLDSGS